MAAIRHRRLLCDNFHGLSKTTLSKVMCKKLDDDFVSLETNFDEL